MARPQSKRKTLTNLILLALEKTVDGVVRFDDLIHKPKLYAYYGGWDYPLKKSSLAKAFNRLREKGLIDLVSDSELAFRLTDKGHERAVLASLSLEDEKWDGRWRLVIWDIPEKRRQARNLLRSKLKQWNFSQWQQSVWATKKNCTKPLRDFIKNIGIEDWVMVIESDNVGTKSRRPSYKCPEC